MGVGVVFFCHYLNRCGLRPDYLHQPADCLVHHCQATMMSNAQSLFGLCVCVVEKSQNTENSLSLAGHVNSNISLLHPCASVFLHLLCATL